MHLFWFERCLARIQVCTKLGGSLKETKPAWMIKNKDQLDQLKQNRIEINKFLQSPTKETQTMLKEIVPYQTITLQENSAIPSSLNNPSPFVWTFPQGYGLDVSEYNYATLSIMLNTLSTSLEEVKVIFKIEESKDDLIYSVINSSYITMSIDPSLLIHKNIKKLVGFSNFIRPVIEVVSPRTTSFAIRATIMLEKL